jgi:phage terminase large subunit GpA-like protein
MLKLPEPALLVTCGIDVQLRYIAVLMVGWNEEAECWVLDWSTIEGDPRDPATLQQFVAALAAVRFEHSTGPVPVHLVGVDSGFATDCVYRAITSAPKRGWKWAYATKGVGGREGEPIVLVIHDARDARGRRGLRPLPINTDAAKAELLAMLQTTEPGRGYVHIPKRAGKDFIKQLTSEEQRMRFDADGVAVGAEWKKKTADARNEGLDTFVINLALFHRVDRNSWLQLLTARHGNEEGVERFRRMYPEVGRIQGIDDPPRRPGTWLRRREAAR